MIFLANQKIMFDDIYEMYYHLFVEIGLGINSNQYLYDQDTGIVLRYKDKYIKASVQPIQLYAGRTDVLFEPNRNYNLMVTIFGYYLDKESTSEDGDKLGYIAQYIEDNMDRTQQRIVLKLKDRTIVSNFYYNIYLGYIECIFKLGGNFEPDLSNFDIIEV